MFLSICVHHQPKQSNPCIDPIYDETVETPSRFRLRRDGNVKYTNNLHISQIKKEESWKGQSANLTIGTIRNKVTDLPLAGLFEGPGNSSNGAEGGATNDESIHEEEEVEKETITESMRLEITAPVLM